MAVAPFEGCELCRRPEAAADRRWRRLIPDVDILRLCGECEGGLVTSADDRGSTPEDHHRLMDMGRRLVGEVWIGGEDTFWFREPVLVRLPPAPEPAKPSEIRRRKAARKPQRAQGRRARAGRASKKPPTRGRRPSARRKPKRGR